MDDQLICYLCENRSLDKSQGNYQCKYCGYLYQTFDDEKIIEIYKNSQIIKLGSYSHTFIKSVAEELLLIDKNNIYALLIYANDLLTRGYYKNSTKKYKRIIEILKHEIKSESIKNKISYYELNIAYSVRYILKEKLIKACNQFIKRFDEHKSESILTLLDEFIYIFYSFDFDKLFSFFDIQLCVIFNDLVNSISSIIIKGVDKYINRLIELNSSNKIYDLSQELVKIKYFINVISKILRLSFINEIINEIKTCVTNIYEILNFILSLQDKFNRDLIMLLIKQKTKIEMLNILSYQKLKDASKIAKLKMLYDYYVYTLICDEHNNDLLQIVSKCEFFNIDYEFNKNQNINIKEMNIKLNAKLFNKFFKVVCFDKIYST